MNNLLALAIGIVIGILFSWICEFFRVAAIRRRVVREFERQRAEYLARAEISGRTSGEFEVLESETEIGEDQGDGE